MEPDEVRVLLVEDDPSVAQTCKLKLELDGYQIDLAPDGMVAMDLARRVMPDIVFLDVRLPKLDARGCSRL